MLHELLGFKTGRQRSGLNRFYGNKSLMIFVHQKHDSGVQIKVNPVIVFQIFRQ